MRMRKLSLVLLLVLIITMIFGMVACDHAGGGNVDNPVIPTPTPDDDEPSNSEYIGPQDAWKLFKDAALLEAGAEKDKQYINVDTAFVLGFAKDSYESLIVARFAGKIDRVNDDNSQILVEFWKLGKDQIAGRTLDRQTITDMAKDGKGTMLFGAYYYNGKLVADMRGIKKGDGVHVVYTDTINMSTFVARFSDALEQLNLSSILYDTIMGYDIGGLVNSLIKIDIAHLTVEELLVNILFGSSKSTLVDYGNGRQVLRIPCDLGLIVTLIPFVQGLIPENIIGLVKDVLGLDLGKIGALAGVALYLEADIYNGSLKETNFSIDVNLNSSGIPDIQEKYGTFQSEFGIDLGYAKAEFAGTPDLDVKDILANRTGSDGKTLLEAIETAQQYSFLTLDGAITLSLDFAQKKVSIDNVVDSFGTLISNLLKQNLDAELLAALQPLFAKEIDFASGTVQLTITLQGEINTRNPEDTKLAVRVLGRDNRERLSALYKGSLNGIYIDASGLLGSNGTKFKIDDINVNQLLDDLIGQLFDKIKGAIDGLKGDATSQAARDYFADGMKAQAIQQALVDNGELIVQHGAFESADGDGSVDVLALVSTILDHINVDMDENIFNINGIQFDLTRDLLETIFGMVFTGNNIGADIPISEASLTYTNKGAQQEKSIKLDATLGIREYNETHTDFTLDPLIGLGLGIDVTFGKITNQGQFEKNFTDLEQDLADNPGAYLPILKNGALNTDLLHVNLSTGLSIDIDTLKGKLAEISVDLPDQELGNLFKGVLVNVLLELGNIEGGLKLDVNADLDLTGGLDTSAILDILLKSSAKIAITRRSDVEGNNPLLAIYLQDGWAYLKADLLCINVKEIKIDVKELIGMLGLDGSGSQNDAQEAAVADETTPKDGLNVNSILGFVAGIIDGFKLGNHAFEVVLAAGLFDKVLNILGLSYDQTYWLDLNGEYVSFADTSRNTDEFYLKSGKFYTFSTAANGTHWFDVATGKYIAKSAQSAPANYALSGKFYTFNESDNTYTEATEENGTHWYDVATKQYVAKNTQAAPANYALSGKYYLVEAADNGEYWFDIATNQYVAKSTQAASENYEKSGKYYSYDSSSGEYNAAANGEYWFNIATGKYVKTATLTPYKAFGGKEYYHNDFYNDYREVQNNVKIGFASTDFDGGIRIALNDGLYLPDFQLGIFLSLGNNVSLDLSLNGLSAGLNDKTTDYLENDKLQKDSFTEILEYPFVGLDLTLGIEFTADQGSRELVFGEGKYWLNENGEYIEIEKTPVPSTYTGVLYYKDSNGNFKEENITKATLAFDSEMDINYELRVAGQLDLSPILKYLLFKETQINTKNNHSELLVELTGKKIRTRPQSLARNLLYLRRTLS